MQAWIWGIAGLVLFLVLVVCGVRIAFAALMAGLVIFLLVYTDLQVAGTTTIGILVSVSSQYSLTVIPLFIFMGFLTFYSGLGTELYTTARSWLGQLPGGLAIATVMACAFFGAISGSSTAAVAMFGKVAKPEMDKFNYHPSLSIGSIAASGTLANLIPPSTLMVIYGMLAEQSIGKLLIAGFLPGLLSAILYSLMIAVRSVRNPRLGPVAPVASWREKIRSLKGLLVIFIVMVIIIGGIYSGVFTPTEAGAWSAFVMLIFVIITRRRLAWPMLKSALIETTRVSCMIFVILFGIKCMTTAIVSTGSFGILVGFVESLAVSRYVLLGVAIGIYILLGAFIGVMGMLVMTVPFIVPLLAGVGFDPIWLGVIVIKFCEIALITPPIGANIYVIAKTVETDVSTCFASIWWFLVVDLLTVGVLILFPQIVTWLPSTMG